MEAHAGEALGDIPHRARRPAAVFVVPAHQHGCALLPLQLLALFVRLGICRRDDLGEVVGHIVGTNGAAAQVQALRQTFGGRRPGAAPAARYRRAPTACVLAPEDIEAETRLVLGLGVDGQVRAGIVVASFARRTAGGVDHLLRVRVGAYKGELGSSQPLHGGGPVGRIIDVDSLLLLEQIAKTHVSHKRGVGFDVWEEESYQERMMYVRLLKLTG